PPPRRPLVPYTTLFRSWPGGRQGVARAEHPSARAAEGRITVGAPPRRDCVPAGSLAGDVTELHGVGYGWSFQMGEYQAPQGGSRSEEHTSELQSRENLV